MDLGTTIIGVVLLLLFILPIIIVTLNSKSGEKKSLKRINEIAVTNNSSISQFEILNNKIIGIDNENLKLFFIKTTKEGFQEHVLNLKEINKCQVLSTNKTIKSKEGSYKVKDSVELSFSYYDIRKKNSTLECFNANKDNFIINGEFQFAEKWEKIISGILYENVRKIQQVKAS